jgi:hypothetical protein
MASYCTEDDMEKIRPKIMELGVDGWDDQIAEADAIIDRALETRWYRQSAEEQGIDFRATEFDRTKLLSAVTECTRLGCYKSFELAYLYLMKDAPESDAFERQAKTFAKLYNEELSEVLGTGLSYDWDGSGTLADTEKLIPVKRRLARC